MARPAVMTPSKFLTGDGECEIILAFDLAPVHALIEHGVPEAEAAELVAVAYEREARALGIVLDMRRGTMADVLRRLLVGPDVCAECGSQVAMRNLCAPCEAGVD